MDPKHIAPEDQARRNIYLAHRNNALRIAGALDSLTTAVLTNTVLTLTESSGLSTDEAWEKVKQTHGIVQAWWRKDNDGLE